MLHLIKQALITPIRTSVVQFSKAIPLIVGAVLWLVVGNFIAKLLKNIASRGLDLIQFDDVSEKLGLGSILQKCGLTAGPTDILADLIYWFVFLIFIAAAANSMHINVVTALLGSFIAYIPSLIVAAIVVAIGLILSNFAEGALRKKAEEDGMSQANLLANGVKYLIIVFVSLMALQQLHIADELVRYTFIVLLGSLGLGLGLAFGLGGKETAAKILENLQNKKKKK